MLIDAHVHLDHYAPGQLEQALAEIERQRILSIAVAMDPDSYQRSRQIAAGCAWALPAFGVHPWRAPRYSHRLDELAPLIEQSPLIGEIGLDYHWAEDPADYPAQRQVFEFFLDAARRQRKIINLHTKGAEEQVATLLAGYAIDRAIVHWYSGPVAALDRLIDLGCYFTIGVEVRYSESIRRIARRIPLEQVLTETDNPGGEQWLSGEIGMPGVIDEVAASVAQLRGITTQELQQVVETNFRRLVQPDTAITALLERLSAE